jgi:hypothetical protein
MPSLSKHDLISGLLECGANFIFPPAMSSNRMGVRTGLQNPGYAALHSEIMVHLGHAFRA